MTFLRPALAAATLLLAVGSARADDAAAPPFVIGSRPAWLLLGGVTTGGTVALADRGAFVGAEVSLARLRDAQYAGVYADGYYDWGAHGTYLTTGLEVGHSFLGLDGGLAVRFVDASTDAGLAARVTVGLGVAAVYARYAHFYSTMDDRDVLQVGVVLKLPLWTQGGSR